MNRARLGAIGAVTAGSALAVWSAFGVLRTRSAERVDYTVERTIDDRTEIRRYPELVRVETTGDSTREAFGRLFDYIQGANESRSDVSMTAPVRTDENTAEDEEVGEEIEMTAPVRTENGSDSESVSMTAPVRTDTDDDGVRMGFYLPANYTPNTAPRPTDSQVSLAVEPPRSVATRRFSWWRPDWRTRRQASKLLDSLDDSDVEPVGEPFSLGYNDPSTPPFLRTNEVAVDVEWADAVPAAGPSGEQSSDIGGD
ncbi:SOUL family heme-binding protein [Halococcus thailandensis]|uniref:SOUL heme-binding protein n=1 Tax=Halococcus thailandensis JCM 13552 TaxID=1227457 RepID=M0MZP6_9EURY|nr:heme-binding protein [Halococcus thailandensis]EMA50314.1 SOUL heme-binding protein [Halococcus thailandensis JCM 13552]